MAKKFDLIVFDWDGTLLDSTRAIVSAIQASCRDMGVPEPTDFDAKQVIGLGLLEAMRHSAPALSEDQIPAMADRYRHHYFGRDHELATFDGINELLVELHNEGFLLAIATGKGRVGLNRALEYCGFGHLFSATRCGDECFSKPHPQMLEELMDELSVPADRVVMIGDTTHDMQLAINAGVTPLAVTYGAHPVDMLAALKPAALLDNVEQLAKWLRENA